MEKLLNKLQEFNLLPFLVVSHDLSDITDVYLQGNKIKVSTIEKHLGVLIGSDCNTQLKQIQQLCGDLYSRVNLLFHQFGNCYHDVILFLFRSYCTTFYGALTLDLSCKRTMDFLYKAYRKCLRRLLKLPY